MKKMTQSDLTARINKFMDRKLNKTTNASELTAITHGRSQRQFADFDTQFIALAIK